MTTENSVISVVLCLDKAQVLKTHCSLSSRDTVDPGFSRMKANPIFWGKPPCVPTISWYPKHYVIHRLTKYSGVGLIQLPKFLGKKPKATIELTWRATNNDEIPSKILEFCQSRNVETLMTVKYFGTVARCLINGKRQVQF